MLRVVSEWYEQAQVLPEQLLQDKMRHIETALCPTGIWSKSLICNEDRKAGEWLQRLAGEVDVGGEVVKVAPSIDPCHGLGPFFGPCTAEA